MAYEKELKVAKSAAVSAGEYLRRYLGNAAVSRYKGNSSNYATFQDIESNKILAGEIRREFLDDQILSEEGAAKFLKRGRGWAIDPCDGTRNYLNGLPYFSVSVAFWEDGEIKVGVVYAPCFNDELYHAVKNEGTHLNGKPLVMINPGQELKDVLVATGFAYFKGNELDKPLEIVGKVINNCADIVRYGSAALDICQVAAGRFGAFYENGLKPWDVAAAKLILEESGGVFSDYHGKPADIFKTGNGKFSFGIVAAKNKAIASELIRII